MPDVPRHPAPIPAEALGATLKNALGPGTTTGRSQQTKPNPPDLRHTQRTTPTPFVDLEPVVIGLGATYPAGTIGPTVVGVDADSAGDNTVAVGHQAQTDGDGGVAVGWLAHSTAIDGTAIGAAATAGHNGTALGASTYAAADGSVAIGMDSSGVAAIASNTDDFILGTGNHNVSVPGAFAVHGATPVGQSAAPTTLADVIAILQAHGLCA